MSNTQGRVKRIIDATEEQWSELVSILFKMGINVPIEPFDFELYSNSKQSMKQFKASSIHKLQLDLAVQLFYKIAHELGIQFITDGNNLMFKYNNMSEKNYQVLKLFASKNPPNTRIVEHGNKVILERVEE